MPTILKKYKKISGLIIFYILIIIIFYYIYQTGKINTEQIKNLLDSAGIIGFIILGIMYSQVITGPIATAILIIYSENNNIFLTAIIVALGASLVDFCTYEFFKYGIHDELIQLKNTKPVKFLSQYRIWKNKIFLTAFGFMFLALPLPSDIGIAFIEEENILKTKYFLILDFILNTGAIYLFLWI